MSEVFIQRALFDGVAQTIFQVSFLPRRTVIIVLSYESPRLGYRKKSASGVGWAAIGTDDVVVGSAPTVRFDPGHHCQVDELVRIVSYR